MDRRRLLKAMVSGSALAVLQPNIVFGQALPAIPPLTPVEATFGNAIGRWTGRVEALGQSANDNEVRRAITQSLNRASGVKGAVPALTKTAPFLARFGRVLGPVGVAIALLTAVHTIMVSSDGEYVSVSDFSSAATLPSATIRQGVFTPGGDSILEQIPENGMRHFRDANRLYKTEWSTTQILGGGGQNKYGPNWKWLASKIDRPVAIRGYDTNGNPINVYGHLFQYIANAFSRPFEIPQSKMDTPEGLNQIMKIKPESKVTKETQADILKQLARLARNHAVVTGEPTTVPDPDVFPPLPSDFAGEISGSDLVAPTPGDRDINFGFPISPTEPGYPGQPDPGNPVNPGEPGGGTGTNNGNMTVTNWGTFTDPGLALPSIDAPEIPSIPELIDTLANPLKSLIPVPPAGGVECPAIPWFLDQQVTQHCGAMSQLQPFLGNLTKIIANITAMFMVLRE